MSFWPAKLCLVEAIPSISIILIRSSSTDLDKNCKLQLRYLSLSPLFVPVVSNSITLILAGLILIDDISPILRNRIN